LLFWNAEFASATASPIWDLIPESPPLAEAAFDVYIKRISIVAAPPLDDDPPPLLLLLEDPPLLLLEDPLLLLLEDPLLLLLEDPLLLLLEDPLLLLELLVGLLLLNHRLLTCCWSN